MNERTLVDPSSFDRIWPRTHAGDVSAVMAAPPRKQWHEPPSAYYFSVAGDNDDRPNWRYLLRDGRDGLEEYLQGNVRLTDWSYALNQLDEVRSQLATGSTGRRYYYNSTGICIRVLRLVIVIGRLRRRGRQHCTTPV